MKVRNLFNSVLATLTITGSITFTAQAAGPNRRACRKYLQNMSKKENLPKKGSYPLHQQIPTKRALATKNSMNSVLTMFNQSVKPVSQNQFLNSLKLAQRRLKPVSLETQNAFAKSLASRRDFYDATLDMQSFIKKMRLSNDIVFKNETDQPVTLALELGSLDKNNNEIIPVETIIESGEVKVLFQKEIHRLVGLKLIDSDSFLNPKWISTNLVQIAIESRQDRNFLHQFHGFKFESHPFTSEQLNDIYQTDEERAFKHQFNDHIGYVANVLAPAEGLTLAKIDEHRQRLFERNNIAKILERDVDAIDRYENKIPMITHKIWVTADDKPVSIPNYYLKWYENSIEHNPVAAGWTHILWIESKEKLPELARKLEHHPNIKIMELKHLGDLVTGDLYKQAIINKQFGKATDILRLEILKKFGGFYLDTDYELFQSLKPYCKVYDMVMSVEPMSALLCNAFIGACPDHPVVDKGLELIMRNMNQDTAPDYIKNNPDKGWRTIIETGPAMISVAFALAAGKIGYTDIALPPMLIYPTPVNEYPRKQVVKPGDPIPAEAIGAHYWETAWMRAEFGSQG